MSDRNLLAIHDRIDEEHFQVHLHSSAIESLQRKVAQLEAAVGDLRELIFNGEINGQSDGGRLAKQVQGRVRAPARRGPKGNIQGQKAQAAHARTRAKAVKRVLEV